MASFSRPVPGAIVASSGSRSKFPIYIHQNYDKCVEAAKETEHEYNQAMSTNIKSNTLAEIPGLGLVHPMALTIANCLPDRLAAITRFADFTILNDDYYDSAKKEEVKSTFQRTGSQERAPHSFCFPRSKKSMMASRAQSEGSRLPVLCPRHPVPPPSRQNSSRQASCWSCLVSTKSLPCISCHPTAKDSTLLRSLRTTSRPWMTISPCEA